MDTSMDCSVSQILINKERLTRKFRDVESNKLWWHTSLSACNTRIMLSVITILNIYVLFQLSGRYCQAIACQLALSLLCLPMQMERGYLLSSGRRRPGWETVWPLTMWGMKVSGHATCHHLHHQPRCHVCVWRILKFDSCEPVPSTSFGTSPFSSPPLTILSTLSISPLSPTHLYPSPPFPSPPLPSPPLPSLSVPFSLPPFPSPPLPSLPSPPLPSPSPPPSILPPSFPHPALLLSPTTSPFLLPLPLL